MGLPGAVRWDGEGGLGPHLSDTKSLSDFRQISMSLHISSSELRGDSRLRVFPGLALAFQRQDSLYP